MSTPRNTATRPSRIRHTWRAALGVAALAVAGVLGACSDSPSAPTGPLFAVPSLAKGGTAPGHGAGNGNGNGGSKPGQSTSTQDTVWLGEKLAAPVVATSLERKQALSSAVTATFVVTKDGGQYSVPGTGLTVWVQPNTVSGEFPLTVTALAGKAVAYEFGPSGSKFSKSLIMVQDLKGTNYNARVGGTFDAGYFASSTDVDLTSGTALVKERLQNYFDAESGKFYFAVNHFSGYMVSWGFSSR